MQDVRSALEAVREVIATPLLTIGSLTISLQLVGTLLVAFLVTLWTTRWLQRWLKDGPLLRTRLDASGRHAVATVTRYVVFGFLILFILQASGIDLTTFNVLAGAVGLGVGFGLQSIVANFIAGIIIMFERPIKLGDRIDVNGIEGNVVRIGARGTTIIDNDGIAVIVPNSKFITENVVNWQAREEYVRFHLPVSVAYGSDARLVERLLLEVAAEDPDVLDTPEPGARLLRFGDNGLEFELLVWSRARVNQKRLLMGNLNMRIYDAFTREGVTFPFPQRDLHVKGGVLEVRQLPNAEPDA